MSENLNLQKVLVICFLSIFVPSFALAAADVYEADDTMNQAKPIMFKTTQRHNFHIAGDQDWVKFDGVSGNQYKVSVLNFGIDSDVVIELHKPDGTVVTWDDSFAGAGDEESIEWKCSTSGTHYVKITHFENVYGDGTEYDLTVDKTSGNFGSIIVTLTDECNPAKTISGVQVELSPSNSGIVYIVERGSSPGSYIIDNVVVNTYMLTFTATGYQPLSVPDVVVSWTGITLLGSKPMSPIIKNTYYLDTDGDGYGIPKSSTSICSLTPPEGYVAHTGDCDDSDAGVHPGVSEICDGKDNNCDGQIDEGLSGRISGAVTDKCSGQKISGVKITVSGNGKIETIGDVGGDYGISLTPNISYTVTFEAPGYETRQFPNVIVTPCQQNPGTEIELTPLIRNTYYRDADGDGYGDPNAPTQSCSPTPPAGYATNNGDCNDSDTTIHPGAPEICDGTDNNCDRQTDEGCQTQTYYKDADNDGYSDGISEESATRPAGYKLAQELILTDGDCNDNDPAIHPTLALPDVISILKILSGINTYPPICLKNQKLEMWHVIYILQRVAGLR